MPLTAGAAFAAVLLIWLAAMRFNKIGVEEQS
jgi:hypothetical protein